MTLSRLPEAWAEAAAVQLLFVVFRYRSLDLQKLAFHGDSDGEMGRGLKYVFDFRTSYRLVGSSA